MKRNNKIWSITIAAGRKYNTVESMTKSEAKATFNRVAEETTKSALNDSIDLLVISKNGNAVGTMERVGKGEYAYHINGDFTLDGGLAFEMLKAV